VDAVHAFVTRLQGASMANVLAQIGLKLTVPGMPDTYQGCELEDFSLVDPDNRRPVDYALRQQLLTSGEHPKMALTQHLLTVRKEHPDLFAKGDYRPLEVRGAKADNIIAFTRSHEGETLTCAIALRCAPALLDGEAPVPPAEWWEDTTITLEGDTPEKLEAAHLFATSPVHVTLNS
jgi:(1->4)-alpha-D-glucan 1-alpha-D-glucosylmutase